MNMTSAQRGTTLLGLARNAIAQRLGVAEPMHDNAGWLAVPGATFVTLTQDGALRGCIGSLAAWRPLHEDVSENAVTAALHDPRFPKLRVPELPYTRIEVSLLSPLSELAFTSEQDALAQLRPGIDGVVLRCKTARGTFLPQVWDSLPEPRDFLAQLKCKAGLPADFWSDALRLERYTVTKWREPVEQGA